MESENGGRKRIGRGGRTRTDDFYVPDVARYQLRRRFWGDVPDISMSAISDGDHSYWHNIGSQWLRVPTIQDEFEFSMLTSLRDRIRGMQELWQAAASDMDSDHVNYRHGNGVLLLVCSFTHFFICIGGTVIWYLLSQQSLWARGGWQERVGLEIPVSVSSSWSAAEALPPLIESSA